MENLPSLASLFARVFGFTLLVLIAAAVCRPAAPLFSRLRAYFSKSARLLRAAKVGNAAAVRRLLAAGADVNTQDAGAWTPLLWAAQQGHAAVLRLLLENGANIGHQGFIYGSTNPGWSALTLSVNGGHIECTKILLKYGATDKDKALGSALWGGRRDIAALLKEYGADATTVTNRADRHGRTDFLKTPKPIFLSVFWGVMVRACFMRCWARSSCVRRWCCRRIDDGKKILHGKTLYCPQKIMATKLYR